MANQEQILQALKDMFPEFEKFGLDVDVYFDQGQQSWMAYGEKNGHELRTHLEDKDVQNCVEGEKCYRFGVQLGQFIRNYCEDGNECEL